MEGLPHLETERQGPVLVVRLANESGRNALSRDMRYSLRELTRSIQDDRSIRAVYLTGKGKSFCAGGDLNMLTQASEPWDVHRRFGHAATMFPPFLMLDRPVVCGVRGHAVGGGLGIALMCDLIVASTQSQRGVLTVDVEPMLLHPLIDGAALGVSTRVDTRIDCAPDLWVLADPTRVQQMIGNLVSNAVKYGAAPIEIEARADDRFVSVRVIDHGAGVPVEFRDRLFGQFARAQGMRVNGMGLGLFVVRSLTEAQGGRAWYEPIETGGSAFCFSLPIAAMPGNAAVVRPEQVSSI